jgi:ferric-dicitrate binding protein FerR (iron transport regulator)
MRTFLSVARFSFLASMGCIYLGLAPLAAAADAPEIGSVAALRGSASVRTSSDVAAALLAIAALVHEGEIAKTGADSRLKLALRDGSRLSLGADSELMLDRLALGPDSAGAASRFTQLSGYVRAVVEPGKSPDHFEIQTPSMVAAVRGTDWIEHYDAGVTEIFVVRGKVLATGAGRYRDSVLLTAGEGVSFSEDAPHTPVVRWKKPKIDLFVGATRVP